MTNLIEKTDSRYFSQTSDAPYDRHHYKIVCQDKSFVVESWDEVQEYFGLKEQLSMLLINQRKNLKVLLNYENHETYFI